MIEMKQTTRLGLLLVLAGILVLSVPLVAGDQAGAQRTAATSVQSSPLVSAPSFMQSVLAAVRLQVSLWLHTPNAPLVKPEITPAHREDPQKSSTGVITKRPWLFDSAETIMLDNGGDVAI